MSRPDRSQDPHGRPDLSVEEAARLRERGRRRVRNTTRWAVVATVAGTAALGAGYAYAIPGSSAKPAQPATGPSNGVDGPAGSGHSPSGGSATQPSKPSGGLRTPAQPPAPTTQPPQTTSGGS